MIIAGIKGTNKSYFSMASTMKNKHGFRRLIKWKRIKLKFPIYGAPTCHNKPYIHQSEALAEEIGKIIQIKKIHYGDDELSQAQSTYTAFSLNIIFQYMEAF